MWSDPTQEQRNQVLMSLVDLAEQILLLMVQQIPNPMQVVEVLEQIVTGKLRSNVYT